MNSLAKTENKQNYIEITAKLPRRIRLTRSLKAIPHRISGDQSIRTKNRHVAYSYTIAFYTNNVFWNTIFVQKS